MTHHFLSSGFYINYVEQTRFVSGFTCDKSTLILELANINLHEEGVNEDYKANSTKHNYCVICNHGFVLWFE